MDKIMSKQFIEVTGKSLEDATEKALLELNLNRDDIEVEILEKSKSGFLGFGSTQAKIKVTYEAEAGTVAKIFLNGLFDITANTADITEELIGDDDENKILKLNVSGENTSFIIGRRGETLDAIQYITSIVSNRGNENHTRIMLDTENYRAKRHETLEKLATKTSERVLKYKRSVTMEPMTSQDRRSIHTILQDVPNLYTYSTGEEPNRCVVIAYGQRRFSKGN